MPHSEAKAVAAILCAARAGVVNANAKTLPRIAGVPFPVTTEAQGYAVQRVLSQQLESKLGRVVGSKVGCTTPVMQTYMGIKHPCAGRIYKNTVHTTPAIVRHSDYHRCVCMHAHVHTHMHL